MIYETCNKTKLEFANALADLIYSYGGKLDIVDLTYVGIYTFGHLGLFHTESKYVQNIVNDAMNHAYREVTEQKIDK